jgi:hypothetical protein
MRLPQCFATPLRIHWIVRRIAPRYLIGGSKLFRRDANVAQKLTIKVTDIPEADCFADAKNGLPGLNQELLRGEQSPLYYPCGDRCSG